MREAKILNTFFTLVFTVHTSPLQSQLPVASWKVVEGEGISGLGTLKLHECRSTGPSGLHISVLRELLDGIARPFSITFSRSQPLGEVPEDHKKANVTHFQEKEEGGSGEVQTSCLISVPWNVMEQNMW